MLSDLLKVTLLVSAGVRGGNHIEVLPTRKAAKDAEVSPGCGAGAPEPAEHP